jgi:L-serine dehydratase
MTLSTGSRTDAMDDLGKLIGFAPSSKSVAQAYVGVFDLFRIGIGPSSSHTVGPMRAAKAFINWTESNGTLALADRVSCELYGSLALTGRGHATDVAVIIGLGGLLPESVDPDAIRGIVESVRVSGRIRVGAVKNLFFAPDVDLVFRMRGFLSGHPNGLTFKLWCGQDMVAVKTYYSIGGGFIQAEDERGESASDAVAPRFNFRSAEELLTKASAVGMTIVEIARENERAFHTDAEIDEYLDQIWIAMKSCVARGLSGDGVLPGGLSVRRRARKLYLALCEREKDDQGDPLRAMEWVNLFALAVNEENAAGGRVVTAPTNGAAGIIPAVIHYYDRFVSGASREGVHAFLIAAAAIGSIIKRNASISGADVGCQGEVGSAAAMAAAGLAAALGGTNGQIENAAEIALEHSLGLTCDPVAGLVQIPCIERNAVASVKAVNAARLSLLGDGTHRVSLDQVIETMRQTGKDMNRKYKETSRGGLAVNVPLC